MIMKCVKPRSMKMLGLLVMLLGIGVQILNGQTVSGTLRGTITDSNGAFVPNATVTVRNKETGLERTIVSSDSGLYNIPFLPIGEYRVVATRTDFNTVTRDNVRVSLNETTVVNVQLDPSLTGEVTVTADVPPINSTNAQIAGSLTSEQILERPVANQGSFLTLAETFTGFQENPTGGQNNPTASSGSSINFNGTGSRGATFQINGVNNDDSSENQNRQGASLATIKEFQVITNNFTAEFGRGYGAVVLVQTKSGTNKIDGEAYLYHNDNDLNAKSFFAHGPKAVNRRNQFGGVVGFPVWKNNLFGFLSVDEVRNSGDGNFRKDVFTVAEHDPANWFNQTPANNTPGNRAFIQSVLDRFGDLRPNDPTFARVYNGAQGRNFPANDYTARLDWNPGTSDTVSARWQYSRQVIQVVDVILGENAFQNNKQVNIGVTWTHNFNSNVVGEFRYGRGFRNTLVNLAAGNDTPIIRFAGAQVAGSIIGNSGAFPIQRYQTDNQFVYNVSAAFGGSHFVKFGTDIRIQKLNDLADNFSRGFWNFAATCNGTNYGTGFNAFLNGCISTFQKGYGPFTLANNIGEKNVYVEDNWKIFSNLTFNLGLRYEYVNAPKEANDLIDYGFGDDKDNWEPRVGFAYSPGFEKGFLKSVFGGSGLSSIRGGYGLYHGRLFQSVFSQNGASVRTNPPQAIFLSFTQQTNLQDPTNGFVFVPGPQAARHTETLVNPDLEMPYTQQWNLTFERQLPWQSALRLSYTGNRGIGLLKYGQGNTPQHDPANGVLVSNHPNNAPNVLYSLGSLGATDPRRVDVRGMVLRPAADILCAGTGLVGVAVNATCPVAVPLAPNEYSFRVLRTNERRPDGRFTTNLLVSNGAWSYYDGMQAEWIKRLSNGLNFSAAYTWSKSIDTTSEATFVGAGDSNQNGNDAKASRGLSRFHTPHRFTLFGTYRTPFFDKDRGILGHLLGGWQSTMVFRWAHGTPFTVTNGTGTDLNFDGFAESRPVIVDPSILGRTIGDRETSVAMLPRSAFRAATAADFGVGILGRNTFYADGVKSVDLAFAKSFQMPWLENHRFHIRADLFNAFNMKQWGFPNADLSSASFGQITGLATQYAPRSIQISLRYSF